MLTSTAHTNANINLQHTADTCLSHTLTNKTLPGFLLKSVHFPQAHPKGSRVHINVYTHICTCSYTIHETVMERVVCLICVMLMGTGIIVLSVEKRKVYKSC